MDDALVRDPLSWTIDDLQTLVGRHEGLRLELKGPSIDVSSATDRQIVARAVAGMQSSDGGYVLIGVDETDDTVRSFAGISLGPDGIGKLRRSLLDSVYPQPTLAIHGLAADDPGKVVVVIRVAAHPLGLPSSVDGRFFIRIGDETRVMSYDEVARRFRAVNDVSNRAAERVRDALKLAQEDFGGRDMIRPPFQVAVLPVAGPSDWGLTGRKLLEDLNVVVTRERATFEKFYAGPLTQIGPTFVSRVTRSTGVAAEGNRWRWTFDHNGLSVILVDAALLLAPGAGRGHLEIVAVGALAARFASLSLSLLREIGLGGPILVHLHSGAIQALVESDGPGLTTRFLEPPRPVSYEFAVPLWGATFDTLTAGVELFCQRIVDGLGAGSYELREMSKVRGYLSEFLQ